MKAFSKRGKRNLMSQLCTQNREDAAHQKGKRECALQLMCPEKNMSGPTSETPRVSHMAAEDVQGLLCSHTYQEKGGD